MAVRFTDESFGFGWMQLEFMQRTSHALAAADDGGVVLVDPVDDPALDARVRALGRVAAVVQLLDRHDRDSSAIATRYGVPYHRLPRGTVGGTQLQAIPIVDVPGWHERALWWPDRRILVVSESLGSPPYYRAPGERRLAVHPMRRPLPPSGLLDFAPARLLLGHGEGLHEDVPAAMREAIAGARRNLPAWLLARAREFRTGRAGG